MDGTVTPSSLTPYSWSDILSYYKNPLYVEKNLYNLDTSARPTDTFQPQYSYAQMRYLQNKGLKLPAPEYNVQDPSSPLSAYASEILKDYNTRTKKNAITVNDAILQDYLKQRNAANNITWQSVKSSLDEDLLNKILSNTAYNPKNATNITDAMIKAYTNEYNLGNDIAIGDVQSRIADEFNASRAAQQAAYDEQLAKYKADLAKYNENPTAYYGSYAAKPTASSTNPYLQNLYTKAGVNQPVQQMADGGLVQDQFAGYGTQLRNIPPLSMLRGGK